MITLKLFQRRSIDLYIKIRIYRNLLVRITIMIYPITAFIIQWSLYGQKSTNYDSFILQTNDFYFYNEKMIRQINYYIPVKRIFWYNGLKKIIFWSESALIRNFKQLDIFECYFIIKIVMNYIHRLLLFGNVAYGDIFYQNIISL